jgi:SAM-dependent methyltransferase
MHTVSLMASGVRRLETLKREARTALERRTRELAPTRRLRFELVLRRLTALDADRPVQVLDAGCEDGLLSVRIAARRPRWRIDAVDLNPAAIERARGWAVEAGVTNVTFRQADVTGDLGDASYDVVLAIECLAEIPDADAALVAMSHALRPGGMLLAHVPQRDWRPVLRSGPKQWQNEVRHGFTAAELSACASRAGLNVVAVTPTTYAGVHLAEEVRQRIKRSSLKVRAAADPVMRLAVRLEGSGLKPGHARGLLLEASAP